MAIQADLFATGPQNLLAAACELVQATGSARAVAMSRAKVSNLFTYLCFGFDCEESCFCAWSM